MPFSDNQSDVIIIGSGAGGGVVAKEVGEAGLKVIVREAGKRYRPYEDYPTHALDFEVRTADIFLPKMRAGICTRRPGLTRLATIALKVGEGRLLPTTRLTRDSTSQIFECRASTELRMTGPSATPIWNRTTQKSTMNSECPDRVGQTQIPLNRHDPGDATPTFAASLFRTMG